MTDEPSEPEDFAFDATVRLELGGPTYLMAQTMLHAQGQLMGSLPVLQQASLQRLMLALLTAALPSILDQAHAAFLAQLADMDDAKLAELRAGVTKARHTELTEDATKVEAIWPPEGASSTLVEDVEAAYRRLDENTEPEETP